MHYDAIIIGAGAAGLFCASNAAARDKRILVLDHANKVGKKILMSGGGRCNFTNLNTSHENFYSENPHFCKSALSQYNPYQFLALVESYHLDYVEKGPGQLFCKHSSKDILKLLLDECAKYAVKIYKKCQIENIEKTGHIFSVNTSLGEFQSEKLVIATGGLSIPTLGASGYGYELAKQFGHELVDTKAALVPFTLNEKQLKTIKDLSGVSQSVEVCCQRIDGKSLCIKDELLFTHRGLSGPAILRLSTEWPEDSEISINLLPELDIVTLIEQQKRNHPEQLLVNNLSQYMAKRLAAFICPEQWHNLKLKQVEQAHLKQLSERTHHWTLIPLGTEGYRTAEVTLGGVNTDGVSSKTFESTKLKNLYFIGEVLDVTGELGGYNFQWAWASAWCAAQHI